MFEMIDGVGKSGPGPVELGRAEKGAAPAPVTNAGIRSGEGPVESAVFGLVSGGAPVDGAKVAAIRAAIAEGRYPVDADRIAERMIALDLPRRG
jgi:negative regulator of flagellin synthesis FlgM